MNSDTSAALPDPADFEAVACYFCGEKACTDFVTGQDDLTGKPGSFRFVTCDACGLAYQNPRLNVERIKDYYDDESIELVRQFACQDIERFGYHFETSIR